MKIHVRHDHIDKGVRNDYSACPIALALKEATRQTWHVDGDDIYPMRGSRFLAFPPTEDLMEFINTFDDHMPVEPFEFDAPIEKGGGA